MKNLNQVLLSLTLVFSQFIVAQNQQQSTDALSLDEGTIDSQFEYIFRKSGNFKGTNGQKYEAVKYLDLLKLKANTFSFNCFEFFRSKRSF